MAAVKCTSLWSCNCFHCETVLFLLIGCAASARMTEIAEDTRLENWLLIFLGVFLFFGKNDFKSPHLRSKCWKACHAGEQVAQGSCRSAGSIFSSAVDKASWKAALLSTGVKRPRLHYPCNLLELFDFFVLGFCSLNGQLCLWA